VAFFPVSLQVPPFRFQLATFLLSVFNFPLPNIGAFARVLTTEKTIALQWISHRHVPKSPRRFCHPPRQSTKDGSL
jgi:hypothetical protein